MSQVNISGRSYSQQAVVAAGDGLEVRNDAGNPLSTSVPGRSPVTTSVASSATSKALLEDNSARRGLIIWNNSTEKLYVSFAETATTANAFAVLAAGERLVFDQQLIFPDAISAIWASANGAAQVTEFI